MALDKIAPGVWQLTGFPPHALNVFFLEDVLLDTGTRFAGARILRALQGRPLSLVAVTHTHPDHQGCVKLASERRRVPVACPEADVASLEGRSPMLPDTAIMRLGVHTIAGPPCKVDRVLLEGDLVGGFRVVHAPGHTPGHIMLFRDSDGIAIAGDVVNNRDALTGAIRLGEPPDMYTENPAENRRSMRRLVDLNPKVVCFGHGAPLYDIERLRRFVAALR